MKIAFKCKNQTNLSEQIEKNDILIKSLRQAFLKACGIYDKTPWLHNILLYCYIGVKINKYKCFQTHSIIHLYIKSEGILWTILNRPFQKSQKQ